MVTVLDAIALGVLLRAPRPDRHRAAAARPAGAWWWLAFLLLLGPIAMGRLDAVVAPVVIVALAIALQPPAHRDVAADRGRLGQGRARRAAAVDVLRRPTAVAQRRRCPAPWCAP